MVKIFILVISAFLVVKFDFANGCAGTGVAVGGAVGGGTAGAVGPALNALGAVAGKCIYEEADVRMADGTKKLVKFLEIGEEVLAYSREKGVHPSRIVGQLHHDNETLVTIMEIETSTGRKIPVTGAHSLFVRQCLSDDQKWTTKSAHEINVGDCLPRYHTEDGDVVEESVVNVRVFDARGIRQPVTETGTIIVDDVVISCYDRVVNQDATHLALYPYRWFMGLTQAYAVHVKSLIPSLINWISFNTALF